jgi:hypothetical protein
MNLERGVNTARNWVRALLTHHRPDVNLRHMRTPASRVLRASTAIAVIALFAAWQPVMMACMNAMPPCMQSMSHGMDHAPQHPGTSHVPAAPSCCNVCACNSGSPVGVAAAVNGAWSESPARVPQFGDRPALAASRIAPHRLPFSIGPPHPLA